MTEISQMEIPAVAPDLLSKFHTWCTCINETVERLSESSLVLSTSIWSAADDDVTDVTLLQAAMGVGGTESIAWVELFVTLEEIDIASMMQAVTFWARLQTSLT